MAGYKHILITSDLSPASLILGHKAQDLAQLYGAKLSILHVIEFSPLLYGSGEFAIPVDLDLEAQLEKEAKEHIAQIATELNLDNKSQWVLIGNKREEIVKLSKEIAIDLIVVGAHDKHGLSLLFSSTADSILHALPCDILAIRIENKE